MPFSALHFPPANTIRDRLKTAREALIGAPERQTRPQVLLARLSSTIDVILTELWPLLALGEGYTLVAVGGYGRGQQYPYSDVDLLILTPETLPAPEAERIGEFVSYLWDTGLDVGHSVRSCDDCIREAAADITVQTTLTEARWLAGDAAAFHRFKLAFWAALDPRAFCEAKLLELNQRHSRYFGVANNLEPNTKESPGGLRDLHLLIWIAQVAGLGTTWEELEAHGLLTRLETRQLQRAERILQAIRIALHQVAKRREDRLVFDLQARVAQSFNLVGTPRKRDSEQLMQGYYRAAKVVRLLSEVLLTKMKDQLFGPYADDTVVLDTQFCLSRQRLTLRDPELFQHTPAAILDAFLLWQGRPDITGFSPDLLRAVWHALGKINEDFRKDPANRERFMRIFSLPQGQVRVLRLMNQLGVLGRYIPAFGRIVGQMQHDLFHVYTVDEHILMVVRNLRRFMMTEFNHEYPLCSRLMLGLEKPECLYLAGLFHDIGKGRGGDHSQLGKVDAYRFCKQHNLSEEDSQLVSWLVEHHLTMSNFAQKQDLADPDVITQFAALVGDTTHLTYLYLLTVADIRGTSPKVWNGWKAKLLEDLYHFTLRQLSGGTAPNYIDERKTEALSMTRLYGIQDGSVAKMWERMDSVYFLRHTPKEIAWHARSLYFRMDTPIPVVKCRLDNSGDGLQVLIYLPDQQNLFARVCQQFERSRCNIVNAKIFTTRQGYALDSFRVLPIDKLDAQYRDLINLLEYDMTQTLTLATPLQLGGAGKISRALKHFPIEPHVNIRPDDRDNFHVLSFAAGDRPGLLARVAHTLASYQISIHAAQIATYGERVEDTLLIAGKALTEPKTVVLLESALLEVLR